MRLLRCLLPMMDIYISIQSLFRVSLGSIETKVDSQLCLLFVICSWADVKNILETS